MSRATLNTVAAALVAGIGVGMSLHAGAPTDLALVTLGLWSLLATSMS